MLHPDQICNEDRLGQPGQKWLVGVQQISPGFLCDRQSGGAVLSVALVSVRFMARTRQLLPAGLAQMPAGPGLAAVLDTIELPRLSGSDCVEVMRARHRQASHEQARLMAAMVEVARCGIGPDEQLPRTPAPDEFAADEIRAALAWTRRAADTQLGLAWDLDARLPEVFAALDSGQIDVPKARVFSEWTHGLTDDQAHEICARLLPEASRLTTGQLIDRVKRLAIAIDGDWAPPPVLRSGTRPQGGRLPQRRRLREPVRL